MGKSLIPTGKLATGSFLKSIARDTTANTLAISAAAMLPLMAMVGGGVDASRYYMTESRLQAACDAGALAARRAMDDNDFTNEHKTVGLNFFDNNYKEGTFGLESLQRDYVGTDTGEVNGKATGTLPSSIMGAFGYNEFPIEVNCQADINIANTDIVMVLDTTGSMDGQPIADLRAATLSFYDVVEEATSDAAQVRYGIVPYSSQVNVGHLLQPNWMKANHTFQSRETIREFGTPQTESIDVVRTGSATNFQDLPNQQFYSEVLATFNDCVDIAFTNQPGNNEYITHDPAGLTLVSETANAAGNGNQRTVRVFEGPAQYLNLEFASGQWFGSSSSTNRECRLFFDRQSFDAQSQITIVENTPYTWDWEYKPVSYDLAGISAGSPLNVPTGDDTLLEDHAWNGCIEEAQTVNTNVWDPVPSGAFDIDIDLVPSNEAQRWAPMLPTLVRPRYADGTSRFRQANFILGNLRSDEDKEPIWTTCPRAARQLDEMPTRLELEQYLSAANGFVADGATYHDIGMVWGGRMISPDGIFGSRNQTGANGQSISRHIVFMTDGVMFGNNRAYSPYGYEWWDRRVTSDGDQDNNTAIHAERFQAACRAVRNKNITVWVVAFGTELSQNLKDCATPGRALVAADGDELDDKFREIAEKIADLRLTQ